MREALEEEHLRNLLEAEKVLARIVRGHNEEQLYCASRYLRPVGYHRGNPEERKAELRQKLAKARHRTWDRNLGLQQATLPFRQEEVVGSQ